MTTLSRAEKDRRQALRDERKTHLPEPFGYRKTCKRYRSCPESVGICAGCPRFEAEREAAQMLAGL